MRPASAVVSGVCITVAMLSAGCRTTRKWHEDEDAFVRREEGFLSTGVRLVGGILLFIPRTLHALFQDDEPSPDSPIPFAGPRPSTLHRRPVSSEPAESSAEAGASPSAPSAEQRELERAREKSARIDGLSRWGEETVAYLVAALGDAHPMVRAAAARSLGKIGLEAAEALPALVRRLSDGDESVSRAAREAIGNMGRDRGAAVPAFLRVTRSEPLARAQTAFSHAFTNESAIPALVEHLADDDRELCVNALARIGGAAVPALIEALRNEHPGARRRAAWALGQLAPDAEEPAAALARLLKDTDAGARSAAALALVRIGYPSVPVLIEYLSDPDREVRYLAAFALGRIGPEAALALVELWKLREDEDPLVRKTAGEAAWQIETGEPLPGPGRP